MNQWLQTIRALILTVTLVGGCTPTNDSASSKPGHHVEGGFRNLPGSPVYAGTWRDTVSAYTDRIAEGIRGYEPTLASEYILGSEAVRQSLAYVKGTDALTWLGHATFLINLDGKMILTDPFLTDYATGTPPFGPKRATPPALTVGELPAIDIVIVSHNHYDHLDVTTIDTLPGKKSIHVVVPLGIGPLFIERGYTQVTELDWYDTTDIDGIAITATPAIHNSGRSLFDQNETLWAGYLLSSKKQKVFFCGDSAYGPVYPELARKMGPVDYAVVPIGVYEPRQRMKSHHMNPSEAVKVGQDLQARILIAMHWGTIRLSDEPFEEPPRQFRQAAGEQGWGEETAWILKVGESRRLTQ
ncbi:MAG: hydrolase [Gammaproteobacteria bacterium]|nr:hydrolase [Gammaproteobacteria bacterium]